MEFSRLEILIGHYYTVRAGLVSARTSMPDAEELSMDIQVLTTQKSRESLEYRKAFIADVQKYLEKIHWCDQYVLMGRIRPTGEDRLSWSDIIKIIKVEARGRIVKSYYRDPSHMSKKYRKEIYPQAESYFRAVGYLR